jgi:hypothetical protein
MWRSDDFPRESQMARPKSRQRQQTGAAPGRCRFLIFAIERQGKMGKNYWSDGMPRGKNLPSIFIRRGVGGFDKVIRFIKSAMKVCIFASRAGDCA